MNDLPVWNVGNRNPSITDTIMVDDTVFDLSSSTVKFMMRAVGSSTPKVNATAVIVNPPGTDGEVRYDWAAADVDTAGNYLVWWEVTTAGKTEDVGEALIEFRAHAGPAATSYVELEEMKQTLALQGESYADMDIQRALGAASRAIDGYKNTRFFQSEETRYYTPDPCKKWLEIDDLVNLGTVAIPTSTITVDMTGDGVYETTWTDGVDFDLTPDNADLDGQPFSEIVLRPQAGRVFPNYRRSVKITAVFGWPEVPELVLSATSILAHRWLRRRREAPFGVIATGIENGAVIRLSRTDPDVAFMLDNISGLTPRMLA